MWRGCVTRPKVIGGLEWGIVHRSLCYQTYQVREASLQTNRVEGGGIYVAISMDAHNMPIHIQGCHASLCYNAEFDTYANYHRFCISARSLLRAAPFDIRLRVWGEATYRVDENCEFWMLCTMVREFLPKTSDTSTALHLSWPPREHEVL